ncbi:MAG: SDR family oxidoreductase [Deltaproteobacteria bacterium]|nr:SDR family oxidoreductase [Deltaproteobacteria bacterium]
MISGYRGLAETLIGSLIQEGYSVSVLVRNQQSVPNVSSLFPNAFLFSGDIDSLDSCSLWIEKTIRHFGQVNCLINNAAVTGPGGRLHEIHSHDFEKAIHTNFLAPVFLCQKLLPHFLSRENGTFINLSGGGATGPRPFFSAYSTAKCALVRMTENLALEYPQLRFYAISPGALKTPMMEKIAGFAKEAIGSEHAMAKKVLSEGGQDPKKTAKLVLWLLKNQPSHLSGKLISAIWDDYENEEHASESGFWTLRRVDEMLLRQLEE